MGGRRGEVMTETEKIIEILGGTKLLGKGVIRT